MVKLCVGVSSPEALAQIIKERGENPAYHITRNFPKRAVELLAGGSLYWIFSSLIRARQKIVGLEQVEDEEGQKKCKILLDPKVIKTKPLPHRPFQGWRYLEAAPPDSADDDELDPRIIKELGLD